MTPSSDATAAVREPVALTVLDEITWRGKPVPGYRTHALLRALVAAGPRGLSEDALIDEIWSSRGMPVPANPARALQVVVSRARAATCAEAVERTSQGYRLALAPGQVDAWAVRPEGLRLAAEGRYAEALPLLERADQDDEVLAALLRAEAETHGVPAALARYGAYREALAESLGIDPSPGLQALHLELLARDQPVRSGIGYEVDEMIGRAQDVMALHQLVRAHRLTSIVGAGGLGKTRLARLIARTAEQPVVHFVELAGVTADEGVALEVADALGVRESMAGAPVSLRRADLLARIVDAIASVPCLLVLDNCEHVVDAAASLVSAVLAATPALRVLTTTRSPLGLATEHVYWLPELSLEDGVALFVQRAVAARPSVAIDEAEVRRLVLRLDGLPLAIELAAAKVRVMSVAEIAERLDNRFELLRGGSRDAPERHQTLLAVIDWSWSRLSAEEQASLRRIAVFRDGFSLAGATAVVGYEALEPLTALIEQSLVVVREDRGGVRYRLLETVREFALLQLATAAEKGETQQRLRCWAMDEADTAFRRLYSPDQATIMQRVRREEGNLVDVLRQSLQQRDVAGVAVVFAGLAEFWTIEGTHLKVLSVAAAVEQLLLSEPIPLELVEQVSAGLIAVQVNCHIFGRGPGQSGLDRLRELAPALRSPRLAQSVRLQLAIAPRGLTDSLDELKVWADDPDPVLARLARMWSAVGYENEGNLVAARAMAEGALALCDDSDGPWMRALLTQQLSSFALQSGDFAAARAYELEALPLIRELGAHEDAVQLYTTLALVALHAGDYDDAQRLFDEAAGQDPGPQIVYGGGLILLCGRAELLLCRGEVAAGLAAYAEAAELIRSLNIPGMTADGYEPLLLYAPAALVAASVRHGQRAQAYRDEVLARAARVAGRAGATRFVDVPILGCALFALAVWELVYGQQAAGEALLAYADRFAFSRMLPSFDWTWATSLGRPAEIAPGKPADLLNQLHALLTELGHTT